MFRSLVPWTRSEISPFGSLQSEMNRLFDDFTLSSTGGFQPRFEMSSDPEKYSIRAELAGLDSENVKCDISGGRLTIKGEKKDEREEKKDDVWFSERRYGQFNRSMKLPDDADIDKITASFDKGMLTVIVPRTGESVAGKREVPIK